MTYFYTNNVLLDKVSFKLYISVKEKTKDGI